MQDRLQEIRNRLSKIRKGNWSKVGIVALINYGKKYCGAWDRSERTDGKTHDMPLYDEDADFIANAPSDVEYLLGIIDGLQRQQEDRLEEHDKIIVERKLLQRKLKNANRIVDEYQNEIVPGFREMLEKTKQELINGSSDKEVKGIEGELHD